MLGISTEKVVEIIACAKEHDTRSNSWKHALESGFGDESEPPSLHRFGEGDQSDLAAAIGVLSEDEQASLLALAWIGRSVFPPSKIGDAIAAAKAEAAGKISALMGIPLLADYLEEGLHKLGVAAPKHRGSVA
jgi:hypothetical protein